MGNDKKIAGMSGGAVKRATDKDWKEWFAVLDKVKAKQMTHREIADLLHSKHGVPLWWAQQITVGYEQEKGLRKPNERPDGFQISRSRTISVSAGKLYRTLNDNRFRQSWLKKDTLDITTKNVNKNIRARWNDGKSSITMDLYGKENSKTQLVIQHSKLKSSAEAEKMKKYWGARLDDLKRIMEE